MSKRKQLAIAFTPTPNWLRTWVEEKDRRYWNAPKLTRGIVAYSFALKDLEDFYRAIKIGDLLPNQRSIAYFAKKWNWNWTKTLRFFVHVMEALENLDANFYFQRLKKKAEEYAQKAKEYVYKARGKTVPKVQKVNTGFDDEDEMETAFLDAMTLLAKNNKAAYRAKIKANLRTEDPTTLENFNAFKAEKLAEIQRREEELKIKSFNFNIIIGNLINGKQVKDFEEIGRELKIIFQDGEVRYMDKEKIIKAYEAHENIRGGL